MATSLKVLAALSFMFISMPAFAHGGGGGGGGMGHGGMDHGSTNQVDRSESTALFTVPTYLPQDARHLSSTHYELVKLPIDPVVHTFRPGTALRIVISAPGGDRPVWAFGTLDKGQKTTVGLGGVAASALTVNVVHGVDATPTLPECGALRGEPCGPFLAEENEAGGH